jgi:hypothetical protein
MIEMLRPVERVREALNEDAYRAAIARGRRLSLDEAVAFALENLEHLGR